MKIKIDEIPATGLHKEEKYDPKDLDIEIQEASFSLPIRFSTPIDVSADIYLAGDELLINVLARYTLRIICSRCLEEFDLPFEKKCLFNYNTQNLEVIDITDNIREEIILDYPLKPLCKQDCQGICPGCGVNLNFEKCECHK